MKTLLTVLALGLTLPVWAGVYKCVDADGKKFYRSQPCSDNQSRVELNVKTGSGRDLDAMEKQEKLEKQAQEAQAEEKTRQRQELAKQEAEFRQLAAEESRKNQEWIKAKPKAYSAFAIPPYEQDALPELVKRFEKRLIDIERLRREAAEKALATGECGRVESVELSPKSIEKSLVILVDCSTAKKFYITEAELTPPPPAQPSEPVSPASPSSPSSPSVEVTPEPSHVKP